jgi:hypothetical protein
MQTPRTHWSNWASQLHRLEASAPVTLLGAQALFVASPFLGPQSETLAHLLEEEEDVRAFAAYLREGVMP